MPLHLRRDREREHPMSIHTDVVQPPVGRRRHPCCRCRRTGALALFIAAVAVVHFLGGAGPPLLDAAAADPLTQAQALINDEQFEAAEDVLRPITRQNHPPIEAWLLLGAAYEGQGRTKRAINAYEAVMRLDRQHLEGSIGLGRNLVQIRSRRGQAIQLYKTMLKIYPDEPRLHYGLGMAHNTVANVSYAFEEYKWLKNRDPELARQLYDAIFLR